MTICQSMRCSLIAGLLVLAAACSKTTPMAAPALIVPAPSNLELGNEVFVVTETTPILMSADDEAARRVGVYLSNLMAETSGVRLDLEDRGETSANAITLTLDASLDLESEAYRLKVTADGIAVMARDEAGLFYGAVSLWQLLTPAVGEPEQVTVSALTIEDAPSLAWRGVLLDSARHMQSVEYVKNFIDWMAIHKLNTLHWHLTDDQGWRIEIKRYPRLTEVGAWRVPAGAAPAGDIDPATGEPRLYGGYYSQDQIREIVDYASTRHVTIVPEIDVPGHALAAVVAYPELGVLDTPPTEVMADWGVYPYLFNVEDDTFVFLENVLDEVLDLFPGRYIHIGGDEAPKNQWQASSEVQARMVELGIADEKALQGYFTARLDAYLTRHDRRLVGWDEIIEGGLSPNATVMSWRGVEGAQEAAKAGHDAILAPGSHLYLDYRQSNLGDEAPGRGKVISLADLYGFDLNGTALSEVEREHIIGVQANIWTEHMRTEADMTHMAFPRLAALAELGWSGSDARDFNGFLQRLSPMLVRYQALDIGYSDGAFRPVIALSFDPDGQPVSAEIANQSGFGDIRYTVDGSEPNAQSKKVSGTVMVANNSVLRATVFDGGRPISDHVLQQVNPQVRYEIRDDELQSCDDALIIYLVDDAPLIGDRANFQVNIMDPCWIWNDAPIEHAAEIEVTVGQVPYNFQLMADIDNVVTRPLRDGKAALVVHENGCEGPVLTDLDLAPAMTNQALTVLSSAVQSDAATSDLCFVFHTGSIDPLWVIDSVKISPDQLEPLDGR